MLPSQAPFPATRHRRLRQSPAIRSLVGQTSLSPSDFIWPVFVRDGEGISEPVGSMPGVNRLSVDKVVEAAREAHALGIPAICLFPYTAPPSRHPTAPRPGTPRTSRTAPPARSRTQCPTSR